MYDSDKKEFMEVWNNNRLYYDKAIMPPEVVKMVYLDMAEYQLADVTRALDLHRKRSKFCPRAEDILEILKSVRPGAAFPDADEAWAMSPKGDESKTVAVFDELLEADVIASECLPDKVATRMAFKSAYDRIVNTAILNGKGKPLWRVSLGRDVDSRETGVIQAVGRGLISPTYANNVMPNIPLIEFEAQVNPALESHAYNSKSNRALPAGSAPEDVLAHVDNGNLSPTAEAEVKKIKEMFG